MDSSVEYAQGGSEKERGSKSERGQWRGADAVKNVFLTVSIDIFPLEPMLSIPKIEWKNCEATVSSVSSVKCDDEIARINIKIELGSLYSTTIETWKPIATVTGYTR